MINVLHSLMTSCGISSWSANGFLTIGYVSIYHITTQDVLYFWPADIGLPSTLLIFIFCSFKMNDMFWVSKVAWSIEVLVHGITNPTTCLYIMGIYIYIWIYILIHIYGYIFFIHIYMEIYFSHFGKMPIYFPKWDNYQMKIIATTIKMMPYDCKHITHVWT